MATNSEKGNLPIWIIAGVLIGIAVIYIAVSGKIPVPSISSPSSDGSQSGNENVLPTGGTVVGETDGDRNAVPLGIQNAEVLVPGASPVSEEGVVLTTEGAEARNDVQPGAPEAPQQSAPITAEELPKTSIKLLSTKEGFSPSSFTAKRGDVIILGVTSADEQTHVFKFKDGGLSAVALGLSPGETRAITFNVPETKGEYKFFCDVPGHEARGESGTMIIE